MSLLPRVADPHCERPTGVRWAAGLERYRPGLRMRFACPFCTGMLQAEQDPGPEAEAGDVIFEHRGVRCTMHKRLTPEAFVAAARRHIR
jgi:hypothetical protein